MSEPLSRWLSDQTAELHRQIEADLLPGGRVDGFGDVLRLVTVHARVLSRYAGALDAAQHIPGAGLLSRWRVAAEADLASWGLDSPGAGQGRPASGVGELVGVRYVLEGARVGLRMLAPEVATTVGSAGVPASQFFVPEPDAGRRWHAVRGWLDGAENLSTDRQAVLLGARAAFAAYRPQPAA